jgi:hypothetical protein
MTAQNKFKAGGAGCGGREMNEQLFYIIDLRSEWKRKKYITLWRPGNAGYCFSLPWAGKYTLSEVDKAIIYYLRVEGEKAPRFPVPCEVVDALAIHQPDPRDIDGDVGPILWNDRSTRWALTQAMYRPEHFTMEAAQ